MTTTAKNEPSNELELQSMIDLSPINTMMGNVDGKLLYMNQASMDTLKTLEQYLPSPVEKLVGQSIDIFHKNPSHQRNIISEAKNLPHRATIQLGPEKLDLLISPIKDKSGEYIGPMVTWEIVTEKIRLEEETARTKQMVDLSPMNTMMADVDGNLLYMNESSTKTLKTLEQYLPSPVDQLVGQSIDIFHKNPSHQRNIIGSSSNLPHRAIIQLGPEKLDLLVSPITSASGEYIGPMVTWEVVTEKLRLEEETARSLQMVEKSPINTMMASPDGTLLYLNDQSKTVLKSLAQYLPVPVDQLLGNSIDVFHKNPSMQRNLISDPANMPHRAIIQLGPEKLDLLLSAVFDNNQNYQLVADITGSSEELKNASEALQEIANSLSAGAEETSAQANTASAASEEVNAGVQTVASNMEEMTAAIKEITKTTNESSTVSNNAMSMAQNTNTIISKLGDSSMDIGNVIKVISSIAQQTNLLALNATIEAARAGEAGKGFAVVASEVKELAKQTAKATEEITAKIENIQTDSKGAVGAIEEISTAIEKINSYAGNIAASVEEQAATTGEVSRIVTESAEGVKQINENISQVSEAASVTGKNAMSAQEAAGKLKNLSELLKGYIERLEV
jgi:methyl-accepting chemotaxis protein